MSKNNRKNLEIAVQTGEMQERTGKQLKPSNYTRQITTPMCQTCDPFGQFSDPKLEKDSMLGHPGISGPTYCRTSCISEVNNGVQAKWPSLD